MKKTKLTIQLTSALLASASVVAPAHAQSTVSIYGIINDGIGYVNNQNGHGNVFNSPGNLRGNRLDFAGTEDLGGGYKALFLLENGFGVNNGTLQQGGRLFGRQAYVGMNTPFGQLTFGRQYDFMIDMGRFSAGSYTGYGWRPQTAGQFTGSNGSTSDTDRLGGARVDNAVKYISPSLYGASVSALYGFDQGSTSGTTPGHTLSLNAKYLRGPFAAGATFTSLTDPTGGLSPAQQGLGSGSYQNYALGMSYDFGKFILGGLLTEDRWSATNDRTRSFEINLRYLVTSSFVIGGGWFHIMPNHGGSNLILDGVRNQLTWIADYSFSKRTDVYFTGAFQIAGGHNNAFIYDAINPSSTNRQTALEIGIRHTF